MLSRFDNTSGEDLRRDISQSSAINIDIFAGSAAVKVTQLENKNILDNISDKNVFKLNVQMCNVLLVQILNAMLYMLFTDDGEMFILYKDACMVDTKLSNKTMAERSCDDLAQLGIVPSFVAGDSFLTNNITNDNVFPRIRDLDRLRCRKHLVNNIYAVICPDVIFSVGANPPTSFADTLKPLQQHIVPMVATLFNLFNLIENHAFASEDSYRLVLPHFFDLYKF